MYKAVGGRATNDLLEDLLSAIECIPVSTAECERAFSLMNTVLSDKRNRLELETVSSLMFINAVGPTTHMFKPTHYVKNWLRRGHHAVHDSESVKHRFPTGSDSSYAHVHELF